MSANEVLIGELVRDCDADHPVWKKVFVSKKAHLLRERLAFKSKASCTYLPFGFSFALPVKGSDTFGDVFCEDLAVEDSPRSSVAV